MVDFKKLSRQLNSPWKKHVRSWTNCTKCPLCEVRTHVVLARGSLPCDVLFVGEAPGPSEDVLGQPFVGPAGKLLDRIISDAGWNVADHDVQPVRYAFTNLVACIPRGDDGDKFGEPPKESIEACAPRLVELVEIASPRLIVCVGELSKKWLPKLLEKKNEGVTSAQRPGKTTAGKTPALRPAVGRTAGGRGPGSLRGRMAVRPASSGGQGSGYRLVSLVHPAAILRADIAQRGLAIQRAIVTLRDALEEMNHEQG